MNNSFAIRNIKTGQLNALVKNLMLQTGINDPIQAVAAVNSGKVFMRKASPSAQWLQKGPALYLSVTSDGTKPKRWIDRLDSQGIIVGTRLKEIFFDRLIPTNDEVTSIGIFPYSIAEPAIELAIDQGIIRTDDISLETICLLMEIFSLNDFENMGIEGIVCMHNPIIDDEKDDNLIYLRKNPINNGTLILDMNLPEAFGSNNFMFATSV